MAEETGALVGEAWNAHVDRAMNVERERRAAVEEHAKAVESIVIAALRDPSRFIGDRSAFASITAVRVLRKAYPWITGAREAREDRGKHRTPREES